jgi:hypothetical protein
MSSQFLELKLTNGGTAYVAVNKIISITPNTKNLIETTWVNTSVFNYQADESMQSVMNRLRTYIDGVIVYHGER